ncbi:MAG: glutamine--fructose-6-phosphate transaminase (isomerizing) [Roseovarius sp.]|nr:glutamine--fructose-6-phosphate transaminase (isomerizing) [Roseovarius sp.]
MCGIVGILGTHEVAPTLVEALRRLEYRGYDSAGIATVNDGRLDRRRAVGKLDNLSDLLVHDPLPGKAGIGHTRWATHGAPSVANAHPHRAGPVAVVHNGIIENYRELRAELTAAGLGFDTQTDTETVALLTRHLMDGGAGPVEAAQATLARLEGAYALAFLFDGEPDLIVAARKGSPLAVGHGDGEMYVGSDAIALAPMTDRITYLEEGDCAVITRAGVTITDADGRLANREMRRIDIDSARVDKAGHRHFMMKEIAEQPVVLGDALKHYLSPDGRDIDLGADLPDFSTVERVSLVACGTAFYACLTAKYWFEQLGGLPADADIASEFRYREPPVPARTAAIFVSQSGETADTLAALRYCEGRAERRLAVVNVAESSIARECDTALPILAGAEIGVASTKAFTCQLAVLLLMALKAARDRGRLDPDALADRLSALRALPALIGLTLEQDEAFRMVANRLAEADHALFLGRGTLFPLALEGALKLKEISYIHAEGYASGELKHGPIALIDKSMPVVVMAPSDALFDKTVSNMQEVMARGGRVVLITDRTGAAEAQDGVWRSLVLPDCDPLVAPILYAVPAQLLAYHTAVAKGTDVDQPRNLAKSVTVE